MDGTTFSKHQRLLSFLHIWKAPQQEYMVRKPPTQFWVLGGCINKDKIICVIVELDPSGVGRMWVGSARRIPFCSAITLYVFICWNFSLLSFISFQFVYTYAVFIRKNHDHSEWQAFKESNKTAGKRECKYEPVCTQKRQQMKQYL